MKSRALRLQSAFTIIEVLAIIVVLMVLAAMLLPLLAGPRATAKAPRISCINNLKEVGTAYRLWANDHGDLVPSQQSITNGGWKEFLTNADQGAICWTNYAIMQNELGQDPKLVICPSDERKAAPNLTNQFGNLNLSYFVGVSANDEQPQSIQGGDRNLADGSRVNGDYGYSPPNGKGNDVAVPTTLRFNTTSWSLKIHSAGGTAGAGNILLGDGSAQQASSVSLRQYWLTNANPTTNWPVGHVPSSPSIRLVFP